MYHGYEKDHRRAALLAITRKIHHMIPCKAIDKDKIGDWEIRQGYANQRRIKRLILYMRSCGCQWMLDDDRGGCFMCGHITGTTLGDEISAANYIRQFDEVMENFEFHDIPMLCIYNAGSFFNDREMPPEARIAIYKRINSIKGIKHVIFESRPEYVRSPELTLIKEIIDKHIEIGMGLESANEKIRQVCLNKGNSLNDYLRAVKICKAHQVSSLAYVMLKPLFLSERDAINDAVESIEWAFANGVDVVSVEPVSVQKGTLVHLLNKKGLYRPPWIWSVLNVIRKTHPLGKIIRIGGFEFFPPPTVCVHNCPACNAYFIQQIETYNATNDLSVITAALDKPCKNCKSDWAAEMQCRSTLETNIDHFLSTYDDSDLEKYIRDDLLGVPGSLLNAASG